MQENIDTRKYYKGIVTNPKIFKKVKEKVNKILKGCLACGNIKPKEVAQYYDSLKNSSYEDVRNNKLLCSKHEKLITKDHKKAIKKKEISASLDYYRDLRYEVLLLKTVFDALNCRDVDNPILLKKQLAGIYHDYQEAIAKRENKGYKEK